MNFVSKFDEEDFNGEVRFKIACHTEDNYLIRGDLYQWGNEWPTENIEGHLVDFDLSKFEFTSYNPKWTNEEKLEYLTKGTGVKTGELEDYETIDNYELQNWMYDENDIELKDLNEFFELIPKFVKVDSRIINKDFFENLYTCEFDRGVLFYYHDDLTDNDDFTYLCTSEYPHPIMGFIDENGNKSIFTYIEDTQTGMVYLQLINNEIDINDTWDCISPRYKDVEGYFDYDKEKYLFIEEDKKIKF